MISSSRYRYGIKERTVPTIPSEVKNNTGIREDVYSVTAMRDWLKNPPIGLYTVPVLLQTGNIIISRIFRSQNLRIYGLPHNYSVPFF